MFCTITFCWWTPIKTQPSCGLFRQLLFFSLPNHSTGRMRQWEGFNLGQINMMQNRFQNTSGVLQRESLRVEQLTQCWCHISAESQTGCPNIYINSQSHQPHQERCWLWWLSFFLKSHSLVSETFKSKSCPLSDTCTMHGYLRWYVSFKMNSTLLRTYIQRQRPWKSCF